VLPYRTEAQQIHGVIVTYTDITESQSAIEAAELAQKDLTVSRDRHDKLRALSAALALAEERERRALAQDLHDDLGQLLAVVGIKAAAIRKQSTSEPLRTSVEECVKAIDQANRKLRAMAFRLNPPMLDQLGFAAALEWMIDELHRMYKLEVTIEDDGTPKPMEPAVSATLYRAVRELLINVAKHAGVDKATVVSTLGDGNTLVVTVSDAGTGFDPDAKAPANGTGGFGLLSVRERLSLLGGEVQIRSNPGDGTTVILKAPLLTQADAATPSP
jgi:signal transduction histidine kinase